jgi:hypothetical protein
MVGIKRSRTEVEFCRSVENNLKKLLGIMIMPKNYKYRVAHAVWANDLRNEPFINQDWPCITLDQQSMEDIQENIKFQAENGFNSLAIFGLLTANTWLPDIPKTVDEERKLKVKQIMRWAEEYGVKILYGLGVYCWGYDALIKHDPAVRGTNPKVMCASKEASQRWMEKVIDYLIEEYHFQGFHLEAADLGRCECAECITKSNSQYFCEINTKTAAYIRQRQSDATLLVSMCGYLPQGEIVPQKEWIHYQTMSNQIDCLIDPGHFGTFIPHAQRAEFINSLDCAFGNGGGVWLYPPQSWNRLQYFIPYTQHAGKYLEELYHCGGRAAEFNLGPIVNPAVEVNVAFGGRKLMDVNQNNRQILLTIIEQLYKPQNQSACLSLANCFEQAEDAFFTGMAEVYSPSGLPLSEIHLTYLFGHEPKIPIYLTNGVVAKDHEWYLTKPMTLKGRLTYMTKLRDILQQLEQIEPYIEEKNRLKRIKICLNNIMNVTITAPAYSD